MFLWHQPSPQPSVYDSDITPQKGQASGVGLWLAQIQVLMMSSKHLILGSWRSRTGLYSCLILLCLLNLLVEKTGSGSWRNSTLPSLCREIWSMQWGTLGDPCLDRDPSFKGKEQWKKFWCWEKLSQEKPLQRMVFGWINFTQKAPGV